MLFRFGISAAHYAQLHWHILFAHCVGGLKVCTLRQLKLKYSRISCCSCCGWLFCIFMEATNRVSPVLYVKNFFCLEMM